MVLSTNATENNVNSTTIPVDIPSTTSTSSEKQAPDKHPQQSTSDSQLYGYNLFPERFGEKYKPAWSKVVFKGEGKEYYDKVRCERNVYACVQKSPLVKLLMSALKSSGCEIDLGRHLACEVCDKRVSGGYDPELNQIVVCQNVTRHEDAIQGVLAHEMIHMFDFCRAKLDFKNIDHLACTEIRAANLVHCSFLGAFSTGAASPFSIAKQHAACVKQKAVASVLAVRNVTPEEALEAVERVFSKCYNDLEPIGRRIRRNSRDMEKAYQERYHYGYGD